MKMSLKSTGPKEPPQCHCLSPLFLFSPGTSALRSWRQSRPSSFSREGTGPVEADRWEVGGIWSLGTS